MRMTRLGAGILRSVALTAVAVCIVLTGCPPSPIDDGLDGVNGEEGATITLSDSFGTLVVIQEDEGVGSTIVYGEFDDFVAEPRVTGFDVDAGDEVLVISLDFDGRPIEVTIGRTTLSIQYNPDGSFDYQVYDFGGLVAEGSSVIPEGVNQKRPSAKLTAVTEIDVFECTTNQMEEWASRTILRHQPGYVGSSISAHPFTECLKNSNAVWDVAWTSCVLIQAVQRRLNDAIARRGGEDAPSVVSVLLVVVTSLPFTLTVMDTAAIDVAEQLWSDPACRGDEEGPGCTDTCQYAYDGVCDDGGPNSQYALCELGTDCSDCGPRTDIDGSGDTQAAVCGDGICDKPAGEMTSCPPDCPSECGDEICNITTGEIQSCPQDCPEEQCCIDNSGCPSEGLYDCPGDCCCCASGARCVNTGNRWVCGL